MKTLSFSMRNARCAALALLVAGLGLAGSPAYAGPAAKKTLTLDDARLSELTAERESMFDVTPAARKIFLEDAKADPRAAIRAGLWVIGGKGPARKVSLDDASRDPLSAKRAGLREAGVPAEAKKCGDRPGK